MAAVCMITGAFIFAYVVGSVCSIATNMSADTTEFRNTMDSFNEYMDAYNFPQEKRDLLRSYIIHCR